MTHRATPSTIGGVNNLSPTPIIDADFRLVRKIWHSLQPSFQHRRLKRQLGAPLPACRGKHIF